MGLGVFANADRARLMKQYYGEFKRAHDKFDAAESRGERLIEYTNMVYAVGAMTAVRDSLEPEDREQYTDDYASDYQYNKKRLGQKYLMIIRNANESIHRARMSMVAKK